MVFASAIAAVLASSTPISTPVSAQSYARPRFPGFGNSIPGSTLKGCIVIWLKRNFTATQGIALNALCADDRTQGRRRLGCHDADDWLKLFTTMHTATFRGVLPANPKPECVYGSLQICYAEHVRAGVCGHGTLSLEPPGECDIGMRLRMPRPLSQLQLP